MALHADENGGARHSSEPKRARRHIEDPSPTPEEEAGRQELIREVRAAINALPDAQREVIVMRELHGMSYIEIANATGSDIGTVKSRLSRARAALAEILKKSLGENFSP